MNSLREKLQGKKTYFAVAIGLLYLVGVWAGFWEWDEKVLAAFGLGGIAFLRVALGKVDGKLMLLPFVLSAALLLQGCAGAASQRPPSPIEQHFFDVTTNQVPVVESVPQVVTVTNEQLEVVTVTNVVTTTNLVESYAFTPNERAQAVQGIGEAAGNVWGVGGIIGTALGALFGLWGMWRSRQSSVMAEDTAAVLVQIIETGRQLLLQLPDGAKYETVWKNWMIKHQADVGKIAEISALVATAVDTESARGAAAGLLDIIKAAK